MRDIVMVGETAFLSKTGDMYVNLLRFFMLPLLLRFCCTFRESVKACLHDKSIL